MNECSGYISPEYANYGLYSVKSDIFSFGVLVLEIVSGNKNRGFSHPDHHLNLLGHVSFKTILFTLLFILLLSSYVRLQELGMFLTLGHFKCFKYL
jgi:serine/threonine protein kinase